MTLLNEAPASDVDDGGRCQTSVGKALAILDAFDGAASMLGVSEVARRTALPKSTAYRLLSSLEANGYIERRGVYYALGRRLFELGNQVSWCRAGNLRETALAHMCDLHRFTSRTVHLAVLDGIDVLYVEKLQGRDRPFAPTRVGSRVSARTTALGKAILAFSPPKAVAAALLLPPCPRTPYSILSPDLFRQELQEVRRVGFALDREEARIGVTCVAAPIVRGDLAIAAISVTGAAHSFDPMSIAGRVRDAAAAISRGLV